MVCGILKKLQKQGINYTWQTVREMLSTHMRITTTMNSDDKIINIRSNTTPTADQCRIYTALGIKHDPLESRKIMSCVGNVVMKNEGLKS